MNNTNSLHSSPIQATKQRVKAIKPALRKIGYGEVFSIVLKYYPQYDSFEGARLIMSVWNDRKADDALANIFEQIASGELK